MVITVPPPSDLQVLSVTTPSSARAGDSILIQWTGTNHGPNSINGFWSDAVYLSADSDWDLGDKLLGRVEQNRTLAVGGTYSAQVTATVPGVLPGGYHLIVRSDVFDTIPEGVGETNNQTIGSGTLQVSLDELVVGVPAIGILARANSATTTLSPVPTIPCA